jgi:hypothetical protein
MVGVYSAGFAGPFASFGGGAVGGPLAARAAARPGGRAAMAACPAVVVFWLQVDPEEVLRFMHCLFLRSDLRPTGAI